MFNIDGTKIHPNISIPLNCKDLPSLSLRTIRQFGKKHDQLQLIMLNPKLLELNRLHNPTTNEPLFPTCLQFISSPYRVKRNMNQNPHWQF
jgi:hypothetical protein